jgi:hypothetical protein
MPSPLMVSISSSYIHAIEQKLATEAVQDIYSQLMPAEYLYDSPTDLTAAATRNKKLDPIGSSHLTQAEIAMLIDGDETLTSQDTVKASCI